MYSIDHSTDRTYTQQRQYLLLSAVTQLTSYPVGSEARQSCTVQHSPCVTPFHTKRT